MINGVRRILSFCLVFSLFLTVFAILGMQLFGGVYGDALPASRATFDTFGDAMLALFIVCTGENTFSIGWDLSRASGTNWAVVYVAAWSLLSTSLLALVLGVLIQATVEPVVLEEAESDSDDECDEVPDEEPESERETRETLNRSVSMSLFASPQGGGSRDASPRAPPEAVATSPFDASSVPSVDADDDAEPDEERARAECEKRFEKIRKYTEVEVAAVRLWLDDHGFDVAQRNVLRVGVVDGEVRRCLDDETQRCRPLAPADALIASRALVAASKAGPWATVNKLPSTAKRCMSWVNPAYQNCLAGGDYGALDTIVLDGAGRYARSTLARDPYARKDGGFAAAAFFHYQEWKKKWKSFSGHGHGGLPGALLATRYGVVPVPPLPPPRSARPSVAR